MLVEEEKNNKDIYCLYILRVYCLQRSNIMGYEPYTTEQLFLYYQNKYNEIAEFNINNIYFVDNLQKIADKYNIKESCEGMNGFTIPFDEYIIVILNNLNGFDSIVALFHELTHVYDFIWFSKKYNVTNIYKHNLYLALQMYSEINAFQISNELTIDFLSNEDPIEKQYMYETMNLKDSLYNALCKKEIQLYDIFQSLGYILLYDKMHHIDEHISHIPDSVSPRLRGAMQSILDAYFEKDIEKIDSIIGLLLV